jgi:hypothetical protein
VGWSVDRLKLVDHATFGEALEGDLITATSGDRRTSHFNGGRHATDLSRVLAKAMSRGR